MPSMAEAFSNTPPPELKAALKAADEPAFAAAFRRTPETCDSCHKMAGAAAGSPFISSSTDIQAVSAGVGVCAAARGGRGGAPNEVP
ncbi:hypothetical protein WMF18_02940 [Sorangium sp. So ce315]|uniref:hypothetical protein n=1 Tax=Sorangium sp. So ce315 TaxID=3133299 RepID=UPI003F62931F